MKILSGWMLSCLELRDHNVSVARMIVEQLNRKIYDHMQIEHLENKFRHCFPEKKSAGLRVAWCCVQKNFHQYGENSEAKCAVGQRYTMTRKHEDILMKPSIFTANI